MEHSPTNTDTELDESPAVTVVDIDDEEAATNAQKLMEQQQKKMEEEARENAEEHRVEFYVSLIAVVGPDGKSAVIKPSNADRAQQTKESIQAALNDITQRHDGGPAGARPISIKIVHNYGVATGFVKVETHVLDGRLAMIVHAQT